MRNHPALIGSGVSRRTFVRVGAWIHACKTGVPTTCHFGCSGPLTEANHLGNVAYRAGVRIEWDSKNLRILHSTAADKFLQQPYRDGWVLE